MSVRVLLLYVFFFLFSVSNKYLLQIVAWAIQGADAGILVSGGQRFRRGFDIVFVVLIKRFWAIIPCILSYLFEEHLLLLLWSPWRGILGVILRKTVINNTSILLFLRYKELLLVLVPTNLTTVLVVPWNNSYASSSSHSLGTRVKLSKKNAD